MKRILVVDDSPLVLQIVRGLLEAIPGVQVSTESDGALALGRMDGRETWDLVLLDMEMPGMAGIEVVEAIHACGRREPIVAFTADERPWRARLLALGVETILPKPVDGETLRTLVEGARPTNTASAVPRLPPRWPASVPFAVTLQRFNGNLDLYQKSLTKFSEEYRTWATGASLRQVFPDVKALRFFLHTLKGVAGYLGSREIVAAIEELQTGTMEVGERLEGALVQFLREVDLYLVGLPKTASIQPGAEGTTMAKTTYLAWVRSLILSHDSAVVDLRIPTTEPALDSEEVLVLEKIRAMVQDYEFEKALPLAQRLTSSIGPTP